MDGVVRVVVEHNVCGAVRISDLGCHESEPLVFVHGVECYIVPLHDHFGVSLPEFDGCAGGEHRQCVDGRQVDGRLVVAVPAPALPVGAEVVVVPVLVAPRGGHGQDPLRLDDVVLAHQLVHGRAGHRRFGRTLAGLAHGLLDRAVPLLRLRLARPANGPFSCSGFNFQTTRPFWCRILHTADEFDGH